MALARRRLYLILLTGWVVFTFLLTSVPNPKVNLPFRLADKAAHAGFYAVTGFLCVLWRRESGVPAGRAVFHALLFAAATGAVDEIHQHWIPGRSASLSDWAADVLGGAAGALISRFLSSAIPSLFTE